MRNAAVVERERGAGGCRPAIGLIVVVLAGCYPAMTSYYQPSAMGGVLQKSKCTEMESVMRLNAGNLKVNARVEHVRGKAYVGLILEPPVAKTMRLSSDRLLLRDSDTRQLIAVRGITRTGDGENRALTEPFRYEEGERRKSPWIWLRLEVDDLERHSVFELETPPIWVDAVAQQVPVIRFERKTWTGMAPFNC
jgi:hypothetical protein